MSRLACIALLLVVGACTDAGPDAGLEPGEAEASATHSEEALREAKEAVESAEDYAFARRAEFVDAAQRELTDIQQEMEGLREVVERSSGAKRAQAEAEFAALRTKLSAAEAQLDRAEEATESSWDELQSTYRRARVELKLAVEEARQRLSDRIEP